jgi:chemotaxis protein MotB
MKKTFYVLAVLSLTLSIFLTSCVSKKKFMASEANVVLLKKNNLNTLNELSECNNKVIDLNTEITSLHTENAMTQNDLKNLTSKSKLTIADQAKRLKNLQEIIQFQTDRMSKLKNLISDALLNYKSDELYVYLKDGNVYISMEEKLLFKSGSAALDPKGKEALKTLAQVLNSTKDINVMIEGHTDNVPIKTAQFKDNWDLSTARATNILRVLTNDYAFDANRITASGKSEFHPIKSNDTPEGRAANRRTEIILSPDLKELQKILYQ